MSMNMTIRFPQLFGDLSEEAHMQLSPSYDHPPNKVCCLCRALDGLSQSFESKDLSVLNYFVGFEVTSSSYEYYVSQVNYVLNIISRVGLTDNKVTFTPFEANVPPTPANDILFFFTVIRYKQLVDGLIYLTIVHFDIAYAVHIVSQFIYAPRITHYVIVELSLMVFIFNSFVFTSTCLFKCELCWRSD